MAKKRTPPPAPAAPAQPAAERAGVTADRFTRLYRLLRFLGSGPKTRDRLTKHLRLDVRGFYRDLELLRGAGISINLDEGRYGLVGDVEEAVARLPLPDPHLTLGEAQQLARGRTRAHQLLREHLERILS